MVLRCALVFALPKLLWAGKVLQVTLLAVMQQVMLVAVRKTQQMMLVAVGQCTAGDAGGVMQLYLEVGTVLLAVHLAQPACACTATSNRTP